MQYQRDRYRLDPILLDGARTRRAKQAGRLITFRECYACDEFRFETVTLNGPASPA